MDTAIHAALSGWANFYLITGSAAAALTGLQFVVQTLLASENLRAVLNRDAEGGIAAFGSPTVVHFSLSLLISALLCAPWTDFAWLRVALVVLSVGALAYSALVVRRARKQRSYAPTWEDWLWHVVLPVAAYAALLLAAVRIEQSTIRSLFAIAGTTLLLICIGIHNAWDTVTYLTLSVLGSEVPDVTPPPRHSNPGTRKKGRRR